MKGILGDLGVMRIPLTLNVNPIKQRPYRLNPKYKEKVKEELGKVIHDHFLDIIQFLSKGMEPADYTTKKKKDWWIEQLISC